MKHDWINVTWAGFIVCNRCGIVQNEKNHLKPCKGVVKIELRDDACTVLPGKTQNG